MSHEELRQTFDALLRSSITTPQLTRLVNRSIRLAAGLLKARFNRYLVIFADAGYDLEGAAARCVEELFLPQGDVPCARLTSFISAEIDTHASIVNGDCDRLLRRCIFFSVQQGIPDLLGEFDPQYRKILRMVTDIISQDERFHKKRGFFDDAVWRGDDSDLRTLLPAMAVDEVVAQLSRRASPEDSTLTLMDHVFDILDENPEVRRLLPLGDIVTALRDFFQLYWKFRHEDEGGSTAAMFDEGDRERIIGPIMQELEQGILRSYIEREVLDDRQATAFGSAARCLLEDLASGAPAPWFEYHQELFPDIGYEEYRGRHRGRFEYVLGSAKELFLLRCQKYFRDGISADD
ncbi:MAG: hypothetical protein KFF77_05680 [Bacteroidetes bacterium]|nr:hypothetical protein [Bacteroidota bacterium]